MASQNAAVPPHAEPSVRCKNRKKGKALQSEALEETNNLLKEINYLESSLQTLENAIVLPLAAENKWYLGSSKVLEMKSPVESKKFLDSLAPLEVAVSKPQGEIDETQKQLASAYEKLKAMETTGEDNKNIYLKHLQLRTEKVSQQTADKKKLRRQLQNTLHELKGNIRVFCRVRPGLKNIPEAVSYPEEDTIALPCESQERFQFDKLFGPLASQEEVFIEVSEFVQSALDGYKVCIFAYGATATGKTYTMMGKGNDDKGLIPRSFELIFDQAANSTQSGWKYEMKLSVLEIYMDSVTDYFVRDVQGVAPVPPPKQMGAVSPTYLPVSTIEQVLKMLEDSKDRRRVAPTSKNNKSSRSHFVIILKISGSNVGTGEKTEGLLSLIDLAGNEKAVKNVQKYADNTRYDEAKAINLSLITLQKVIKAIHDKDPHIPYRDSKLTLQLQECLSGGSKTLMFLNLSSAASEAAKSLKSLQFATGVKSCVLRRIN